MRFRRALLALLVPAVLAAQQTPSPAEGDILQKAEALVAEGRNGEAMAPYRAWLQDNAGSGDFAAVLLQAASAAPEAGTAIALLTEFGPRVTDAGELAECLRRLVALLRLVGRSEEALALLRAQAPSPWGLLEQAVLLYEQGELAETERLLAGMVRENSPPLEPETAARCFYLLALIYTGTSRYSQAEAAFRTIAERFGEASVGPAVLLARRDFESRRANLAGSEAALQELGRRFPASPEYSLASGTGSGSRVRLAPTPARLLSGLGPQQVPAPGGPETPAAAMALVQTGSFRDEENARSMARDLKAKGFEARVAEAVIREVRYFRVLVGGRQSTSQAQAMLVQLKEAGYEGVLLPAD
jgi:tetratricopeptide (TPR) repeat protein